MSACYLSVNLEVTSTTVMVNEDTFQLKAAAEVLGQHGLEGTTIPRIAQHAGLTPGAVLARLPEKWVPVLKLPVSRVVSMGRRNTQLEPT